MCVCICVYIYIRCGDIYPFTHYIVGTYIPHRDKIQAPTPSILSRISVLGADYLLVWTLAGSSQYKVHLFTQPSNQHVYLFMRNIPKNIRNVPETWMSDLVLASVQHCWRVGRLQDNCSPTPRSPVWRTQLNPSQTGHQELDCKACNSGCEDIFMPLNCQRLVWLVFVRLQHVAAKAGQSLIINFI